MNKEIEKLEAKQREKKAFVSKKRKKQTGPKLTRGDVSEAVEKFLKKGGIITRINPQPDGNSLIGDPVEEI